MRNNKPDGHCNFPTCIERIDWSKWDKPPPGWATVVFNRYTKAGNIDHVTLALCPSHTVLYATRKAPLPGTESNKFQRVIIESPFSGNVEKNLQYLRAAMRHCLLNGEAPYASHALYPQPGVLDDANMTERQIGIEAGFAWHESAEKTIVYEDLGISGEMRVGIARSERLGKPIERRKLPDWRRTK